MTARLWELLQADHDAIWDLLGRINGGADHPRDDASNQRKVAKQLVRLQSAHEFAEERVVVPLVCRHVQDGSALVDEVLRQELHLKRALNELYHLSTGTTEFEECLNTVASENRNHLTYEQNQLWPRLDDALSDEQRDAAAGAWAVARRAAPTRPHPHLAARPRVLSTAGVLVAARDRAVDALRGHQVPSPEDWLPAV